MHGMTIPSGKTLARGGSQAIRSTATLHLVLNLDQILEAAARGGQDLIRLANIRTSFDGFMLTICSDRSPEESMELLSLIHFQWPHHLLAYGGKTAHHLTQSGGLERDLDYHEWLGFQGGARPHQRGIAAAGLEYLEICWNTPRPLMVFGDANRDAPLLGLADLPVLEAGCTERAVSPSRLLARTFQASQPGLRDVIRLTLACLAPLKNGKHSWRLESHRAGDGNALDYGH